MSPPRSVFRTGMAELSCGVEAPWPTVYTGQCSTSQSSSGVESCRPRVNSRIACQVGRYSARPNLRTTTSSTRVTNLPSQHHHHGGMVAKLLVERIELLARGGAHGAGDAEVLALAAGAHFDGRGIEIGGVLAHDAGHRVDEARLLAAHDLDREVAGEGEGRAVSHHRHGRILSNPHLYRQGLSLAGAHHLLLELLVELVHAAEHGARAPVADALAVELDDRQNFLRRRRHPDLVGGAHLGFAHFAELER